MTANLAKILPAVVIAVILVSGAGCSTSPSGTPAAEQTTAVIGRGDISVNVSVDGNLVMPQAFDLHFGAPGNVKEVFVEEGDFVKAGTVLATLDESSLQLDIMAANVDLQKAISDLYLTIPSIQMTMAYPSFYPNASASIASQWAYDEVNNARDLLAQDKGDEAVAELKVAVNDLESCIRIFEDAISNPISGIGNTTLEELEKYIMEEGGFNERYGLVMQWQGLIERMKEAQQDLNNTASAIAESKYASPYSLFYDLVHRMEYLNIYIKDNVNRVQIRTVNPIYPEENLCLNFYDKAEENLNNALELIKNGDFNSAEYNQNLRMAEHNMSICNAILNSSLLILEHGVVQKVYEQYNVEISKKEVALANARENLLKSVIIAPFDGMVVSVGVKKNDILSAVDYTSAGTIQLVDTTDIKFEGLVDEIDTLKINRGQTATIAVDAVPDRLFKGRVTFISPYGTTSGNVVKFAITIAIDPQDIELRGGLSATADIAVTSAQNILRVPLTALETTKQGSFVNVIGAPGSPPEKKPVVLGIQNNQFAEVKSGLKEGDMVVIGGNSTAGSPVVTTPGPPPGAPPR